MDIVQDQEALLMANSNHMIFKGKRTKRHRTMSSFLLSMPTSSSSSGVEVTNYYYGGGGNGPPHDHHHHHRFTASPSDSGELAQSSVEEEDMANCLILLARGTNSQQQNASPPPPQHSYVINKPAAAVGDVYQCKTCDRRFPSFQALGGHRASHKKPKAAAVMNLEEKKPAVGDHEITSSTVRLINNHVAADEASTTLTLQINPGRDLVSNNVNKSRVHECSICGAEFSSGQALGGHMRRHRPLPITTVAASSSSNDSQELKKKQRTLLSLDLNLPAPEPEEDCGRESKFPFTSKQEAMVVFSAAPLVDCHY